MEPETWPIMHGGPKDMDFNSKKGGEGAHVVVFVTSLFCIRKHGPSALAIKYR